MNDLLRGIVRFIRSEDGPTTVEYAVLLAVIAIAALVALSQFGDHMNNLYVSITGGVDVF